MTSMSTINANSAFFFAFSFIVPMGLFLPEVGVSEPAADEQHA